MAWLVVGWWSVVVMQRRTAAAPALRVWWVDTCTAHARAFLYSCHPRVASHCPTVRDWTPDTGFCIVRGARDNGDALRAAITLVSKVKTLNATIHVVQACGTWVVPACASPLAPFVVSAALPPLLDRTHRHI